MNLGGLKKIDRKIKNYYKKKSCKSKVKQDLNESLSGSSVDKNEFEKDERYSKKDDAFGKKNKIKNQEKLDVMGPYCLKAALK